MRATTQAPWLDNVQIALKQPAQVLCEDLDPTLSVTNAPGDGRVSKALVYNPYVLPELLTTHVNNMHDTNVQWVRLEFKVAPAVRQALAGLPTGTAQIDIDTQFYDNVIGYLCSEGIAVLGLIDYESLTDRRWEETQQVDDQYLDEFATVTQFLVDRYHIGIRYWEI